MKALMVYISIYKKINSIFLYLYVKNINWILDNSFSYLLCHVFAPLKLNFFISQNPKL